MNRREMMAGIAAVSVAGAMPAHAASAITITDLLGRTVKLAQPARRILLAQGRQIQALALIHPDPVAILAGIGGEFAQQDAETVALYRATFPALARVPVVGLGSAASFSLEQIITCDPDLVVIGRAIAGSPDGAARETMAKLDAVGIPTAVIDFHEQPMREANVSLAILGKLIGRSEAADSYVTFCTERLQRIARRLDGVTRPAVFMHAHAGGTECCFSPGKGTFNDLIAAAGGRNLGAELLSGASGQVSPERLLLIDPDIYIGTGGTHLRQRGGLVLGTSVDAAEARSSLAKLLATPSLAGLSAVRAGHVHGLWQGFSAHPCMLPAIETMARWFHPQRMSDIDPTATLAELNQRFLAVPMAGTYWVD